jgi:hypothetical protein
MSNKYHSIHSQQGNAMLAVLMVFLVLSVLGAAVLSMAGLEAKMAINDTRTEQARQAADAGVQVARDIVMNNLIAGLSIPAIPQIHLSPVSSATVSVNPPDSNGIVTITSEGKITGANGQILALKTARAEMLVNSLPNYPVITDRLKAMGKYYTDMKWSPGHWAGHLPIHGPEHAGTANPDNQNPQHYTWWTDIGTYLGLPYIQQINLAPYYVPQGKINIIDEDGNSARVAKIDWANNITEYEKNQLFYKVDFNQGILNLLGGLPNIETYLPETILHSEDFLGKYTPVNNPNLPRFGPEELQRYREIALSNPDEWQYIDASDSRILTKVSGTNYKLIVDQVEKANLFIDWDKDIALDNVPDDFRVVIDFTTVTYHTGPDWISWEWLRRTIATLQNTVGTWFNRLSNEYDHIVIASPASLEVGYDSTVFEMANPDMGIFLLSMHDVDLTVDPKYFNGISRIMPEGEVVNREVSLYSLAGDNINITSTPKDITYKGVIHAGKGITMKIDYYDDVKITSMNKIVNIVQQPSIINQFPEPWAYIGVGPIVSYQYIN